MKINTALEAVGANVEYFELEGADHLIWAPVFSDSRLIDWLFDQVK